MPAFSFIYGIPPKEILEQCHRQGILTIGTATTPLKPPTALAPTLIVVADPTPTVAEVQETDNEKSPLVTTRDQ